MLRAALAGLPMSKDEETRIRREAVDQRGFLPQVERLLLAVDESVVGRTAARLAGLLAGAQGMPVTILKLDSGQAIAPDSGLKDLRDIENGDTRKKDTHQPGKGHTEQTDAKDVAQKELSGAQSRQENAAELKADPLAREVKAGARKSAAVMRADTSEPDPEKVHLTARVPVDAASDVVKDEARKGYDLMFIGLEDSIQKDGGFAPGITLLAAGFEGPLVVFANGGGDKLLLTSRSRLLVPVNGSPPARRAAEIAFALARPSGARVQILFVSQTDGRSRTRAREEGVLKDMVQLGERYAVPVSTRISSRSAASGAILKEARRNTAMIVMGVSARPGEELFFGNTVTAVLKEWQGPALMIAS
jgi:nucleotide-binding universal stress UspA family protein